MHLSQEQFGLAYESIKRRARGESHPTVFMLVSPDIDGICAAHILQRMFELDSILSSVIPFWSWTVMEAVSARLQTEDVRSLVLINLGALIDVQEAFGGLRETLIHVIDSHRPMNLHNLFSHSTYAESLFYALQNKTSFVGVQKEVAVIVWDDGEADAESRARDRDAFVALQYESDSDSDSDADSDDSEFERKQRHLRGEYSDEEDARDGGNSGQGAAGSGTKGLSRKQKRAHKQRIQKYYEPGTYTGQSVANQLFVLALALDRGDEDCVWLSIIGLTYQYLTAQVDQDRYALYQHHLADEVARLTSFNPSSVSEATGSMGPNDTSVRPSEELRFCLFRHWNLYDAMYHSSYVAGGMKLWRERGRRSLAGMLAKMGYSIGQAQETYAHMSVDLKKRLLREFDALAPAYGLDAITYPSFVRKSGYAAELSAADVVDATSALLEAATGVVLNFGDPSISSASTAAGIDVIDNDASANRSVWSDGDSYDWLGSEERERQRQLERARRRQQGTEDEPDEEEDEDNFLQRNFWLAWDALASAGDTALLRKAIPLSMALQRAVFAQGTYILDRQVVKLLRTYRLAVVQDGPDLPAFRHPATLLRLANWLIDSIRDLITTTNSRLPLVVASLNEENDSFLVVGTVGAIDYGDVKKNPFGLAFQRAAQMSGARTRHDAFDANVIEVRKDDLDMFLQLLSVH